jgi:Fe-Mn family superoxide dismutase
MAYELPDLFYPFEALEPFIDKETMQIHRDKHHASYVAKLNGALEKFPDFQGMEIGELLFSLDSLPGEIRQTVRNNGGGHYNHSLFWKTLSPNSAKEPQGILKGAIARDFGGFEKFKNEFAKIASDFFGSGWAWLLEENGKLKIAAWPNHDNLWIYKLQAKDILVLDLWEHAYYLKYQNRRPEYIEAWWNVVNWEEAERRYLQ